MNFHKSSNITDKLKICAQLSENHPQIIGNELFAQSIPFILKEDLYQVFNIVQEENSIENSEVYGLMRIYDSPLIEKHVIGIEAIFVKEDNLDNLVIAISQITEMAQNMKMFAVHFSQNVFPNNDLFNKVASLASVRGCPLKFDELLLQGAIEGIYSAFIAKPLKSAFLSPGITIYTQKVEMNLDGVATTIPVLYRGEGRLENSPIWKVENWHELAQHFFSDGFQARMEGRFNGSLPEQILQQGYVNQPTVSMTDSREVAVNYATNGHKRQEAIVMEIDIGTLSKLGEVYDSYRSMRESCDWIHSDTFEIISKIVRVLDVKNAGEFLNNLDIETKKRVQSFGGGSLGEKIDWQNLIEAGDFYKLIESKITEDMLRQVQDEFETFWNIADGGGMFADNLHLDKAGKHVSTTESILKPTYHTAFNKVEANLWEAFNSNQMYGNLGWDLSPFGYVAKSIRDKEFFSPTSIPGNCIRLVEIVDKEGNTIDEIKNNLNPSN